MSQDEPAAEEEPGGCGCASAPRQAPGALLGLLGLLGLAAARRRELD